ncbi:hypothetical protein M408DRAFT_218382 [Serendipita vermifera MAFF 305830]|uniref:Protein kinase domain-containing protein n=1 Tax=Serendipita vermifera MAFF 305830 TaxID=933852 RepID=A0A0C3B6E9_SERVB|nr:hypothetical protein M408DRAFT_218382 [Serendipita vermifera MAFF 305830]
MLPDHHRERQNELARLLLATRQAIASIVDLTTQTEVIRMPHATPRIYPTLTTSNGEIFDLRFVGRFHAGDIGANLLFLATMVPCNPTATASSESKQVLVKLITNGRYGDNVQCILAEAEYAPTLYGSIEVPGAPTAYVMDYLPSDQGWQDLHVYGQKNKDELSHIESLLKDGLVKKLEDNGIVHGDLRPNNIRIRKLTENTPFEFRVVDFDWSGKSGEATYPLLRNVKIQWPGGAGEPIVIGHDWSLLHSCLKELASATPRA